MSIKFTRAKSIANTGPYHQTFRKIWETIPEKLKESCTSAELAMIVDLAYAQNNLGKKEEWIEMKPHLEAIPSH